MPFFLGRPSPSLQKMQKMSPDVLREHLANLEQERLKIVERMKKRQQAGVKTEHDRGAAALQDRLAELIGAGKQLLESEPGNRRFDTSRPRFQGRR